jgi:hypothetical protein
MPGHFDNKGLVGLVGLPIRKWSTRELQWQGVAHLNNAETIAAQKNGAEISADLAGKPNNLKSVEQQALIQAELYGTLNGQLVGYMVNNSAGVLRNWIISYGRRVYYPAEQEEVPTIQEKGRIKIDDDRKVRSRDLIGYMTNESTAQVKRKYGVGEEIVVTQSEYDLRTRELPYIVYRLSFYDILGGADYTSLTNYELEHLDLSSFLDLDYAVFIAEMDVKDLIPVTADNQQVPCAETTILRVIIPVGRPGSKSASGRNAGNKNSFAPNVEPRYPLPVNSKPVLPQPQKQ